MPMKEAVSPGGIIGAVLGIAIIVGLAGTPFYIGLLRAESTQTGVAIEDQIERVRRVVLNLDVHLSMLSDLYLSQGEEARLGNDEISAILERETDIIPSNVLKELERATRTIKTIETADEERKTTIQSEQTVAVGRPNVRTAPSTMQTRYLNAHTKLLQVAENAIKEWQASSVEHPDAKRNLSANRIAAILYFVKGKIQRNRAEFEQFMAARLWRQAEKWAHNVVELRRNEKAVAAQKPVQALARIEEAISQKDDEIDELERRISQLEEELSTDETQISMLEAEALAARHELTRLVASDTAIHEEHSRYRELSNRARRAESNADALRNGTLEGATLVADGFEDLLTTPYEGGTPQVGVRDKRLRLDQYRSQLIGHQKERKSLQERRVAYGQRNEELDAKSRKLDEEAEARISEMMQFLEEADRHLKLANEASDSAMAAFGLSERYVGPAVSAASQRNRTARQLKAETTGEMEAERLGMIISDGDMEGSLQCLRAETGYHAVLTRTLQILALQSKYRIESSIASKTGVRAPDLSSLSETFNSLFAEANEKLIVVLATYKAAELNVSKTRAKTAAGTIQGKNYIWQIRVAQASADLLGATLLSGSPQAERARLAAYDKLRDAVQGREQSPLLGPALEMLLHLQQSAE